MEKQLIILGSSILLLLGTIHLIYTFFTTKLFPRNNNLIKDLKKEYPVLTKGTTMWKAWIGFNASHSAGIVFFAKINIILVFYAFQVFQDSTALLILDDGFVLFYLFLAKKYWFKTPFLGILLASLCFVVATILLSIKFL
jgi:hypothetical protein